LKNAEGFTSRFHRPSELASLKHALEEKTRPSESDSDSSHFSQVETIRQRVIQELIHPALFRDVADTSYWRFEWRKIANVSRMLGKVLAGSCTVLTFASGAFGGLVYLAFAAGCCNTVSHVIDQYSYWAIGESITRNKELNNTLDSLHIRQMPQGIEMPASSKIPYRTL
jgi:hypothetical protein